MSIRIDEVRIDDPSTDLTGLVQLFGEPTLPPLGPTLLVIGDAGGPIEAAVDVDDSAITVGGFARIREGGNGRDFLFGSFRSDLLYGGRGNDTLLGLSGDDLLIGGRGRDFLLGGSGDDWLFGGAGRDVLLGGSGDDVLVGGDGNDRLNGGSGGDWLFGGAGRDDLAGGSGDDGLFGGAGRDDLEGGSGNDLLDGGAGRDRIDGGRGRDTVSFASAVAAVTVDLGRGEATTDDGQGGVERDTLRRIEDIAGSNFDDRLIGDDGDNDIAGGLGDDTLIGGEGDDDLNGGEGIDTADFSDRTGPVDVDLDAGSATVAGSETNSLTSIENVIGTGADDTIVGDEADNDLDGGAGNDGLFGAAGNDTLRGGNSEDTLDGGEGFDTAVIGGNRADFLIERSGSEITLTRVADGEVTTLIDVEVLRFDDAEIPVPPEATGEIALEFAGRADLSGDGGAEIVAHDPGTQRLFVTTGDGVRALDISDPANPTDAFFIDVATDLAGFAAGDVTSVAVSSAGLVAVAVAADPETDPGRVAFYDADGVFHFAVAVGALPDAVTFTPDGSAALAAIEGQPDDDTGIDPVGGVAIIDVATETVTTAGFEGFDGQEQALRDAGVRIFPGKSVSEDVEPEYIAVSPDGTTAFVTLQEANAVAVVDIAAGTVTDIVPLGTIDHSLAGNGLDTSDRDGGIFIDTAPVQGMFMPDTIASYAVDGRTYYVTANEGDARDEDGRIAGLTLDPTAFPDTTRFEDEADLGRLEVSTTIDADPDQDGDIDVLFSYGTRSFSIWDSAGNLVFDSGDDFESITALALPDVFNTTNDEVEFDSRSDAKGPEPEGVVVGQIGDDFYAFVGLERIGGIMVYNVTDPADPTFVQYINSRDFSADIAGDSAPEGLAFIAAEDSPTGNPLLAVAFEDSLTVAIYEIPIEQPTPTIAINEIRVDQPSSDTDEYFELFGDPGASLDGLSYVVIGDTGGDDSGVVEAVVSLDGLSLGDDGIFVAGEDTSSFLSTFDLVTNLNFENGDNVTHLLVEGFTGSSGQDLDTDNDGMLDLEPWTAVIDSVALFDDSETGQVYSDTVVGPDGSFRPAHVFRLPDGTGDFEIGAFEPTDDTPGAENGAIGDPTALAIYEIQGAGHVSARQGETVSTTGIVTAVAFNGFYLQDPDGDGDDATSDGIFVLSDDAVAVGDEVRVVGVVEETISGGAGTGNLSITRIAAASREVLGSGNALPEATVIGLGGRVAPNEVVISQSEQPVNLQTDPGVFNPETDAIDFYESLEGMRVTIEDAVAVSPTRVFNSFSAEFFTLPNQGATSDEELHDRGGINLDSGPLNTGDQNPERVQVQFDPTLFADGGTGGAPLAITMGDLVGDVTGVVGYSFGNFEVNVTDPITVTPSGLTQETTELVGTDEELTIASYNVLNVSADGSDADQIALLAAQIVNNLGSPDIIALQEIQDNNGTVDDGTVDADLTLQALVDAIDLADNGIDDDSLVYAFFDVDPVDGTGGGVPGGNIRNAFFYNPDRVDLVEFLSLTPDVLDGSNPADGIEVTDPTAFDGTRDPLMATFSFDGEEITVINNHLSSRFGSTPIFGGPQPFVQAGEDAREAQVGALNEVVDDLLAADPDARIVVTGDLNTFEFTNDLSEILPGTGSEQVLSNLVDQSVDEEEAYTFIFDGNSQVLDHMFVTGNLLDEAEFDIVHVNNDFTRDDNRTEFSDIVVASDHEPIIGRFDLGVDGDMIA